MRGMRRRDFVAGLASIAVAPQVAHVRAIPSGDFFRLERELHRGLSDGNHIAVTRRWDIVFTPAGAEALEVTGEQSFVEVDAPAALKTFATMEENRPDAGPFPLHLDDQGRILPREADGSFAALPDEVAKAAVAYARSQGAMSDAEADTLRFIEQLSDRGIGWLSMLPRDLFFPRPRDLRSRRDLALPAGTNGVVEMREIAKAGPVTGMLESFRREVTTIAEDVARRHSETWQLSKPVL